MQLMAVLTQPALEDNFYYTLYVVSWGKKKHRFFWDERARDNFASSKSNARSFEITYEDIEEMLSGINLVTSGLN